MRGGKNPYLENGEFELSAQAPDLFDDLAPNVGDRERNALNNPVARELTDILLGIARIHLPYAKIIGPNCRADMHQTRIVGLSQSAADHPVFRVFMSKPAQLLQPIRLREDQAVVQENNVGLRICLHNSGIVAADVAYVLRQSNDCHPITIRFKPARGIVAGAVVDDDHARAGQVGRTQGVEGFAGKVPTGSHARTIKVTGRDGALDVFSTSIALMLPSDRLPEFAHDRLDIGLDQLFGVLQLLMQRLKFLEGRVRLGQTMETI